MPDYDPDALRENIKLIDKNIARIRDVIEELRQKNKLFEKEITRNNENIRIFTAEIGRLENEKVQLRRLINRIEKKG